MSPMKWIKTPVGCRGAERAPLNGLVPDDHCFPPPPIDKTLLPATNYSHISQLFTIDIHRPLSDGIDQLHCVK